MILVRVTITFSGSGARARVRIARIFRPRRALKRDSEKSTESGGRCKSGATPDSERDGDARASVAALETQLHIEQTKAKTAEQERSALIQTLVTTLSKGSRKGKGKRYKGQNHMSNVKCWNCGKSGHCWRDCREMWWSEEKATGRAQKGKSLKWLSSASVELTPWRQWIVRHASSFHRKTNCQKTEMQ